MNIYQELLTKKKKISVIGLGYVGLPLALEFARHFSVIGFDINEKRVEMMRNGIDPSKELETAAFQGTDITFTTNSVDLKEAHFHIIGVPTDIDVHKVPNLTPLLMASESVGKVLKQGDYVIYESTVYPGCTEEDCIPILEQHSGLKVGQDFKVGYSPERINPGDKKRTLTKILKIVAGFDAVALQNISLVYQKIIEAGIYEAESIKVAEAAKVIENTQRDINIALMNELSMIFDKMQIDTKAVLAAAGTKWNFLPFRPGLVGGHCIGVDPYYLTYKSQKLGHIPQMILSGRKTNEDIPGFIVKRLIQHLIKTGKNLGVCKVLVMGMTFKENVSDVRNTKVVDLVREMESFDLQVDVTDAYADPEEVKAEYGIDLLDDQDEKYDAIVLAVAHDKYLTLSSDDFLNKMKDQPILFDLKGIHGNMKTEMTYWRL